MNIYFSEYDLPNDAEFPDGSEIGVNLETTGIYPQGDRICLVGISKPDGSVYLVQFPTPEFDQAVNLNRLLNNEKILKIFHYARLDMAFIKNSFGFSVRNVYCTKIASYLARTYSTKHGFKDLCSELLNHTLVEKPTNEDWGVDVITDGMQQYSADCVYQLHNVKSKIHEMVVREGKEKMAFACFQFLPFRAKLDLSTPPEFDVFAFSQNNMR